MKILRISNLFAFLLAGFLFNSCATLVPTQEQLLKADYGLPISQQDAQYQAKNFFDNYLKDPFSAVYQWGVVQTGWVREAPINGARLIYGYILDVKVNAKNSFGGYIGYTPYQFVFFNGKIKAIYGQKELSGTPYMGKIY